MMPRFFKDMPKNQPGIWVACVIYYSPWHRREVWCHDFTTLRRAYIAARLMALWKDLTTSSWGEIGIDWAVRKPIA